MLFSETKTNRGDHYRNNQEWLAAAWSSALVLRFFGTRFYLDEQGPVWFSSSQITEDFQRIYLGEVEGQHYFAVQAAELSDSVFKLQPLRNALPSLSKEYASLVVQAVGLMEWHTANQFCSACGGGLTSRKAGYELSCQNCQKLHFPRTDPAVIMLVISGDNCLLGRGVGWPENRFSTLAGFVEPGETLEQAVIREVAEEVGIKVNQVSYFDSQPWPLPSSLMLGFIAVADSAEPNIDYTELAAARWWSRSELTAAVAAGELLLPGPVSISHALIEHWFGAPLPGGW